jgi:hypothetical protein
LVEPDREGVSTLSALLGVARNMFPENVAVAAVDMNILGPSPTFNCFSQNNDKSQLIFFFKQ